MAVEGSRKMLFPAASSSVKDALSEQVELRASIHLTLDEFQPMNLPFDVSVAPR
jgi:hypothetical protein